VKNHTIASTSTTTEAREKRHKYAILGILEFFDACLT
jgi:hypothetical protein